MEVEIGDDPAMAEHANIAELLRTILAQQNTAIQSQFDNLTKQLAELRTTVNAPVQPRDVAGEIRVPERNQIQGNFELPPPEAGQGNNVVDLRGIKLQVPSFCGTNNASMYVDRERKITLFFQCGEYSEPQKVTLATYEFIDYAAQWWEKTQLRGR
ncbi:unnamed protein product [Linum trigynum]|uniref:Uncharacterized protein n=1 Tax=Linum trigynum TaxID=586398 RepID=A0AAV2CCI8_9ROSI